MRLTIEQCVAAVERMDEVARLLKQDRVRKLGSMDAVIREYVCDVGDVRTFFCDDQFDALVADLPADTLVQIC